MFQISSKVFLVNLLTELIIYFIFFSLIIGKRKKDILIRNIFLIVLNFFSTVLIYDIYEFIPTIILVISIYIMYRESNPDYYLMNTVLISRIIFNFTTIVVRVMILPFIINLKVLNIFIISTENFMVLIILILIFYLCRKYNFANIVRDGNYTLSILSVYILIILESFFYFGRRTGTTNTIILGFSIFLLLQLIFIITIFIIQMENSKTRAKRELIDNQLNNLKYYTDELEQNQRELNKFRHDYTNMMLALKSSYIDGTINLAMIEDFDRYSSKYFEGEIVDSMGDLLNIEDPLIKGFLFMKLVQMKHDKIDYEFECKTTISKSNIETHDMIRIIGNSIDNAVQEIARMGTGKVEIFIYQNSEEQEFLIENPYMKNDLDIDYYIEEGNTSKKGHSGFGLSNVKEISEKYDNLFVQYSATEKFSTRIMIIMK
ncbi:sensor histidine kinase [Floricoccus penangensis]|uniref:sensor histidine kinase n=1 Tax=Floricoccus penangensis TaxID=1859475 RepID=UPI00203B5A28|nr:GHKL domain-containing protein [Floricoccus penangensis]URZ87316.1 GHKL domain-containing protein [Floricoccus penangensis]